MIWYAWALVAAFALSATYTITDRRTTVTETMAIIGFYGLLTWGVVSLAGGCS
jgi:hypothetical protein